MSQQENAFHNARMANPTVDTKGAADYTGLAVSTLEKLRLTGEGSPYLKLGRSVRYRICDLEAWMAARVVSSTSQRVAA